MSMLAGVAETRFSAVGHAALHSTSDTSSARETTILTCLAAGLRKRS